MPKLTRKQLLERARQIELVVLDVDGVLTDGGLYYGPEGEVLKRFDVKDGHGLVLARITGLRAAILTARRSKIVEVRGAELGISPISQGNKDKGAGLTQLLAEAKVAPERAAYIGDDLNDLAPLSMVHFRACPADAHPLVRAEAHYVAKASGGRGAVREIVELILDAQGKLEKALAFMRGQAPHP